MWVEYCIFATQNKFNMLSSSQIKPIYKILLSPNTAFTPASAAAIVGVTEFTTPIDKILRYYAEQKVLRKLRKGIYVKPDYNPLEVAVMLYQLSYISLQYVLQRSGVIFQYDESITCVSYLSREVAIDGNRYIYNRIKENLFVHFEGIEQHRGYCIATPERAFLDLYYLFPRFYFDNPHALDKDKVKEILPIYNNRNLERRVCKLLGITDYKQTTDE